MQEFQHLRLLDNLAYLFYVLSGPQRWTTVLDLLLVALTFFLVLLVIRRSRAAVLLRGGLVLTLVVVAITSLLPLPTFDWLLLGALLLGLIATPVIFQPELRRGLERLGRSIGFFRLRPTELAHQVVPELIQAVNSLSRRRMGALIVLEGETNLAEVISTGVPLRAQVSGELLETIFHEKTPLHDGAVIIREDRVEAAACVLPLSEQVLPAGMHQGTRHRAALGISEQSDSLALVVSEETGHVSIARDGQLHVGLDPTELRDLLYSFYDPRPGSATGRESNGRSLPRLRLPQPGRPSRHTLLRLSSLLASLAAALLLALVAWLIVADQVNPPQRAIVQDVRLQLVNQPEDLVVMGQPPGTVAITVQAPRDILSRLRPDDFRAMADLAGLSAGEHELPVKVERNNALVRILATSPSVINLELQPLVSRPITVQLSIPDRDSLPFSYDISGEPTITPPQVTVRGPAKWLEQLDRAEVTVALRGAKSTVQEERLVVLKDKAGKALPGLSVTPDKVQVTIPIRQRFNTRDAAVHVVITGTVPSGYFIGNISYQPQTVTLLGPPSVLNELGGVVDTVPVDVTGAVEDIVRRVPLAPPAGVTPLNERGVTEGSVEVRINIKPQMGNLRLTVPVEVAGAPSGATVSRSPASVDVLLAGPLPVLNQINADPKLVRVLVDLSELEVHSKSF